LSEKGPEQSKQTLDKVERTKIRMLGGGRAEDESEALEEIERIEIWFVGRKPPNSYQKRWKNLKK
jgi:hypothetical protein